MNPPPSPDVDATVTKRIADVLQVLASVTGSLLIVWGFATKIGKPLAEWAQRRRTEIVRGILKDQLIALDRICSREEEVVRAIKAIFADFDELMNLAFDNRDRLDEMNGLMDALGIASRDRRVDHAEHQERIELLIEGLVERRKERRRGLADRRKGDSTVQ